jgi:hypothetical protein
MADNQGFWTENPAILADTLNACLLQTGPLATLPEAIFKGRIFIVSGDSSNNGRTFYDTGEGGNSWEEVIIADPPVDVPGLRTLGTGPQQGAAGNHDHVGVEAGGNQNTANGTGSLANARQQSAINTNDYGDDTALERSFTPATNSVSVVISAFMAATAVAGTLGGSGQFFTELRRGTTQLMEVQQFSSTLGNNEVGFTHASTMRYFDEGPGATSHNYNIRARRNQTANSWNVGITARSITVTGTKAE